MDNKEFINKYKNGEINFEQVEIENMALSRFILENSHFKICKLNNICLTTTNFMLTDLSFADVKKKSNLTITKFKNTILNHSVLAKKYLSNSNKNESV